MLDRIRRFDWLRLGFVLVLFSPEIAVFSYIALAKEPTERPEIELGVPGEFLERHGYILGKPAHYTPWVIEHLTKASFTERAKRDDFTFYADDEVPAEFRATLADYAGGQWDRGHMAPARDMVHSAMAMRDAYRLSNMMPQTPGLNRGEWKRLEEHIAEVASEDGVEVWVVTGPAWLPDAKGRISFEAVGPHQTWAPTHCWKAVFLREGKHEGTDSKIAKLLGKNGEVGAWLMPNVENPPKFEDCRVSIDTVERAAGLDLFSALPDELEASLEAAK